MECYDIIVYVLRHRRSTSCSTLVSTTISCNNIVLYIVCYIVYDIRYDMGCNKVHYTCFTCTINHRSRLWQLLMPHAGTLHGCCCTYPAVCKSLLAQFYRIGYCDLAWKCSPVAPHPDVDLEKTTSCSTAVSCLESAAASAGIAPLYLCGMVLLVLPFK